MARDDGPPGLKVEAQEPRVNVPHDGAMRFCAGGLDALVLLPNGDVLVHGRLAANDREVYEGLRAWLVEVGAIPAATPPGERPS